MSLGLACVACDHSVDTSPRDDTLTFESMTVTRINPVASGRWWLNGVVRNHTPYTVNNAHDAILSAGGAKAKFDLKVNRPDGNTRVGCLSPDPFDAPPYGTKPVRMLLGLDIDPAAFTVACEFEELPNAIDFSKTRAYEAPREGSEPPSDFMSNVTVEVFVTMNDAECNTDICRSQARVVGVAAVSPEE